MRSTFSDGPRRLFQDSYNPFSNALICAMVVVFLSIWLRLPLADFLVARMPTDLLQPWRWLTFSVVEPNIIGLLFGGLALWWVGGSLERSWGTRTFGIFFASIAIITALSFALIGYFLLKTDISPSNSLVIGALVVGWAMLNPDETIHLYGILPIKSRFIAIGICLIIFFSYGWNNPLGGFVALSGCGFAALWARKGWAYRFGGNYSSNYGYAAPKPERKIPKPHLRLVTDKTPRPKDDRFTLRDLNPFEVIARRKRRKQFEKLMKDD